MNDTKLTLRNFNLSSNTSNNSYYFLNISSQENTTNSRLKTCFTFPTQNSLQNDLEISPAYVYEKNLSNNEFYGKIVYEKPKSNLKLFAIKINANFNVQTSLIKKLEPSRNLFEFVKSYEGYSSTAYKDKDGVWTIGIGHVLKGKELEEYVDLKSNKPKKAITEEKAYEFFKADIKIATSAVNKFMTDNKIQLSQNQFDALVSFTFNVGSAWTTNEKSKFRSKIIDVIKNGIDDKAQEELRSYFLAYSKAQGKVLDGLQRRRYDEWEMFVKDNYNVMDIDTWKKIKKKIRL